MGQTEAAGTARPKRWTRRVLFLLGGLAILALLAVGGANLWILASTRGAVTAVGEAPRAQAAIVLGARVYGDGRMSPMLSDRVAQALALYRGGTVARIIVSGDHGRWGYNEPGAMRDALLAGGVPAEAVFTDHAGFDTWSTMRRAREVFGVDSAIVVTQGFHLPRALFLARAAGLDAHGVASDLQGYGSKGRSSQLREVAARVKSVRSAVFGTPVILGPKIPITGDGQASWGPPDPP
jgi:SanA protein